MGRGKVLSRRSEEARESITAWRGDITRGTAAVGRAGHAWHAGDERLAA